MKRKLWTRLAACGMAAVMTFGLAACGGENTDDKGTGSDGKPGSTEKSEAGQEAGGNEAGGNEGIAADSPYADMGFDLSNHETVVMYAIGTKPEDMDKVMEVVNGQYLEPWINTTLDVKFLDWSEMGEKYSLLLTPEGDQVDLMYTSSWCNYASEVSNGGFKELSREFLEKYLPYSYPIQAPISWEQVSMGGKIYTIPKNNATFNNYNVIAIRSDLLEKHKIETIDSWDSMKEALITLAEKERENGIYANGQRGKAEFADHIWWQNIQTEPLASGYQFMYYTHGKEDLPDWDDVFYKFTSDDTLRFYKEMAEMAKAGVWSPDRINVTEDTAKYFENGKSASLIWNASAPASGANMEKNGIGTYEVYDATPDAKAARGSYADDTVAIAAKSKLPERAALVMDCLKGFPELNNLVVGGIEGTHYIMTEDGYRKETPDSGKYNWGVWAWGITGKDSIEAYNEDARLRKFGEICEAKEYVPLASAFTFDKTNVEAELAVIDGIVNEYQESFNLGLFGDDTEAKFNEMKARLEDAGIDKIMEECKAQYEAYCAARQ